MLIRLLLIVSFFASLNLKANIWQNKNQWNQYFEQQYSIWVKKYWKSDIFTNKNSYYFGLSTDCADATYAMRAIFSFEYKLPFVITDPSNHRNRISNSMIRWNSLNQKQRLHKFLNYLNDIISTKSLPHDTYPVPVNPNGFSPGAIYASPGVHSYQLIDLTEYGTIKTLSSTVPKAVRKLYFEQVFPSYVPSSPHFTDGYRRFRQPSYLGLIATQVPGSSIEQFNIAKQVNYEYVEFTNRLSKKLGLKPEPINIKTERFMINLCVMARERISVVNEGLNYLRQMRTGGRRCMNASEFDSYSTPSRDGRLNKYFYQIYNLQRDSRWRTTSFPLKYYAEALFTNHNDVSAKETLLCQRQFVNNVKPLFFTAWEFTEDGFIDLQEFSENIRESERQSRSFINSQPVRYNVTNNDLKNWCSLNYTRGKVLSLRDIYQNIQTNKFISDPHANVYQRWGQCNFFQSQCPSY